MYFTELHKQECDKYTLGLFIAILVSSEGAIFCFEVTHIHLVMRIVSQIVSNLIPAFFLHKQWPDPWHYVT